MGEGYQLYRDLAPAVESALRASIFRFGVLVPVVRDQYGNTLDGHQRARIADSLGVDYPVTVREVEDEDEAREIARTLNEDRRAMPKAERLEVVPALKAEGHSNVAIAGALGVSEFAIRKDLKDAAAMSIPIDIAETVIRKDGRPYPSHLPPAHRPDTPANRVRHPRLHHKNATKLLRNLLTQLNGIAAAIDGVDFSGCCLDQSQVSELDAAVRVILAARKTLKEGSK